jgi:hypothetical protein
MKISQKNFLATCFSIVVLALGSSPAYSQVSLSIAIAPPPLQVYAQPACPDDGYIWTPGYWAYGDNGYYWVPGAWVQPPEVGVFWTPPYWGWNGNSYAFYSGYWGPNVGYYGGINYGYGYSGRGYGGGRWQGNHFYYNTAVNNVGSAHVHYSYADRSAVNNNASRVSFNGGRGGVQAKPTAAQQRQVASAQHANPAAVHSSAFKTQQVASVKSSTASSPKPPVTAVKHASLASQNTHPAVTHVTAAVKPQPHTVAFAKPQSQPAVHAQPQFHPAVHAQPQTHAAAPAQTQSHPASHAQPQTQAPAKP